MSTSTSNVPTTIPGWVFPALSLALTLLTLAGLFWLCGYGLDFTDESYYIEWLRAPFAYTESVTQFGAVYHPLFKALGQNLVATRQVNVLVTALLGSLVAYRFLQYFQPRAIVQKLSYLQRAIVAVGIGCSALLFAHAWLITPNYNVLCLQGLLLTVLGLLWAEPTPYNNKQAPWLLACLLIGGGGVITFLAKISSAAVLAVVCLGYMIFRPAIGWRYLLGSGVMAVALLSASAVLIGGSLAGFTARMGDAMALLHLADSNHGIWDLFTPGPLRLPHMLPVWLLGLTALGVMCSRLFTPPPRIKPWGLWLYGVTVLSTGVACFMGLGKGLAFSTKMAGALFWAAPISCVITGLWVGKHPGLLAHLKNQWALLIMCLLLPWVFSFGTGDNLWHHNIGASIFIALVGIAFVAQQPRLLWHGVITCQLLTLMVLSVAWVYPYRQPGPLWHNTATLSILGGQTRLTVHPSWVNYQKNLQRLAQPNGWQPGTLLLDLTGQSTGATTLLGGSPVGRPWLIGGYPGSNTLATAVLRRTPCQQLANAWLLTEPHGSRKLSISHITEFGANLTTDYTKVGTLATPPYAGGIRHPRTQHLYKPSNSKNVLNVCRSIRNAN